MVKPNSPFIVVEEFISPLRANVVKSKYSVAPSYRRVESKVLPVPHESILREQDVLTRFSSLIPMIEEKYGAKVVSISQPHFQQFWATQDTPAQPFGCESSKYSRKKWVKTKDVDLVGYLWLKSYQPSVPFDLQNEVYGGKIEFPSFDFSLTPQAGTLVLFPAIPNFAMAISHILIGSLEQIKFTVTLRKEDGTRWAYQPEKFPGTFIQWMIPDEA